MEDDKKFRSKSELEEWLKARGIDEDDVRQAAETLFAHGFNKPSTLWGISSDDLKEVGLSIPVARHFSNKLIIKQAQQQQPHQRGDDDDNILNLYPVENKGPLNFLKQNYHANGEKSF